MQINNKYNINKIKNFLKFNVDLGIEFSSTDIKNNDFIDNNTFSSSSINFEKLDFFLKSILNGIENDYILTNGVTSSKILIISDNADDEAIQEGVPFTGNSLILLRNMFKAINVFLEDISIISINLKNTVDNKKLLLDENLLDFELVASRYIEIIKPLYIINMTLSKKINLYSKNLKKEPLLINIANPLRIINDKSLKRSVWEKLKLLREKIDENNV